MLLRVLFFITFFCAYVHALICMHGSFCESDADCVPGSYCGNRQPHYSQCVPNAANASCIAPYSPCGGIGQNVPPNKKCCEGYSCKVLSTYFSQCTPIPYNCTNPTSFHPTPRPSTLRPSKKGNFPSVIPSISSTKPSISPSCPTASKTSKPSVPPTVNELKPSPRPSVIIGGLNPIPVNDPNVVAAANFAAGSGVKSITILSAESQVVKGILYDIIAQVVDSSGICAVHHYKVVYFLGTFKLLLSEIVSGSTC